MMENKEKVAVDAIVATSTNEQISIADAQRSKKSSPWKYALVAALVLLVVTLPYGLGRHNAVYNTSWTIWFLSQIQPIGWAIISWITMVVTMLGLALATIESSWKTWGVVAYITFACEQYLSGLAMYRPDYWWGTKVIFGSYASYANGINAAITTSVWGLGVFVVMYVIALFFIPKDSKLNVFTRSWTAFVAFFIVQICALIVAMFGGLI
ncbi:hypothetical protein EJ419_07150 [Alloscardovia theropitheci]|uniref:Teichoic acid transporter n=1 Tax=Alloscardovia theropitheci TaxID=2496842 RepID=A0A4R0QYX1_9BIFI|nr:hypothetical protein [Alloscardovia theropitheci]TCD53736.1 hypothetical protein EJ419_07150 [Alloscardovia theropitheci]